MQFRRPEPRTSLAPVPGLPHWSREIKEGLGTPPLRGRWRSKLNVTTAQAGPELSPTRNGRGSNKNKKPPWSNWYRSSALPRSCAPRLSLEGTIFEKRLADGPPPSVGHR